MSETVTTKLNPSQYTKAHIITQVTTIANEENDDCLRVRKGPGIEYELVSKHNINDKCSISESWKGWARHPNVDEWHESDCINPSETQDPTPGQIRIESMTVEATRVNVWDKDITIKVSGTCSQITKTIEKYYKWTIFPYFNIDEYSQYQINLYEDKNETTTGSYPFSYSFTLQETSGNSTITLGTYGIGYIGKGTYRTIDERIGQDFTFDIPKYVEGGPPTTIKVEAQTREARSVVAKGTFNENRLEISKYQFRWKPENTETWTTSEEVETDTLTITDLIPNTRYQIGSRAYNTMGWGEWKDSFYFWTKPLADNVTISCTERGKRTATIEIVKGTENYPDINIYDLNYKLVSANTWVDVQDNSTGIFNLEKLTPNMEYQFRGRARTGIGGDNTTDWSDYSEIKSFYTKPSAGTTEAECVRNNVPGEIDIKVNVKGEWLPVATRYQVRYRIANSELWTELADSDNQTQTINDLTQMATYQVQVRARTDTGLDGTTDWSDWSNSLVIKTVKPTLVDKLDPRLETSETENRVVATVEFEEQYPGPNRIYYALTPMNMEDPGPQPGSYVEEGSSPVELIITKDYQGNPILSDSIYKLYVYVNQYKEPSEWYVQGLDLYSDVLQQYVFTTPEIGELDISCVQNNTYDSLKFRALRTGTWSSYQGWQYRYKKETEADINYTDWTIEAKPEDQTIDYLEEGESYTIQIRGSTGPVVTGQVFYSQIYQETVRVAKRPKLTLQPIRIKENEVELMATITDFGYPAANNLEWLYSSNSYITSTYVPKTLVTDASLEITTEGAKSQTHIYSLYHFAIYDLVARLIQYKPGEEWYTAGINNSHDFTLENVELAMYNTRTQRLRVNSNEGFKQVDSLKSWNGKSWINLGLSTTAEEKLDSDQIWGIAKLKDIGNGVTGFYQDSNANQNNEIVSNIELLIPGIDRVRFIGHTNYDNAYGGNLLKDKATIDFGTIQLLDTDKTSPYLSLTDTYYSYQRNKNSLSAKVKSNISSNLNRNPIFELCGIERIISSDLIDTMFIEVCIDTIPIGEDLNSVPVPNIQFVSAQGSSIVPMYYIHNNKEKVMSKFLAAIPVYKLLKINPNYKFTKIGFYNTTITSDLETYQSKLKNQGSIVNFSNFNIFYVLA